MSVVLRLVRFVLLVFLVLLTLSLVIAIARPETGPFEKVVLAGGSIGLLALGGPVRRIKPSS